MYSERTINTIGDVQVILLNIAKEMHRILTAHKIPYFMVAGTLLGAVRHNGFIPWDDDMDFGIKRDYFWKAIEILKKELPFPYKCISYHNSKICIQEACKIMDMSTRIHEPDDYSGEEEGLFIDLFPFDYCDGKHGIFSKYMVAKSLIRLQNFRFTHLYGRNRILKTISYIIKILLFPLDYKVIPSVKGKYLEKIEGEYMIPYDSIYGKKEIIPAYVFEKLTLMSFEDTFLFGLEEADTYLRFVYGNYMLLPPDEKRHTHLVNATKLEGV